MIVLQEIELSETKLFYRAWGLGVRSRRSENILFSLNRAEIWLQRGGIRLSDILSKNVGIGAEDVCRKRVTTPTNLKLET